MIHKKKKAPKKGGLLAINKVELKKQKEQQLLDEEL
jgi:hypothetical protein